MLYNNILGECGGTGRRAILRGWWAKPVGVRIPLLAPLDTKKDKLQIIFDSELVFLFLFILKFKRFPELYLKINDLLLYPA